MVKERKRLPKAVMTVSRTLMAEIGRGSVSHTGRWELGQGKQHDLSPITVIMS
jgi:hypothetical protein